MKNIVVAYDMNRAIGSEGKMSWDGEQKDDVERFKALTIGGAVIMGSRTWDSIDSKYRPLSDRFNIIVSRVRESEPDDDFVIVRSLRQAYHIAEQARMEEISVIGGGQLYAEAINSVDRLYVTELETEIEHPDTFFPLFDKQKDWKVTHENRLPADARNKFGYTFATYLRNTINN